MTSEFASSLVSLPASSEVIVVGADEGGALVASLLARAGRKVTVLETATELSPQPGSATEGRLRDACHHGATVFCGVTVSSVERHNGRWLLSIELPGTGREKFGAPPLFVTADVVAMAAATAPEILPTAPAAGAEEAARALARLNGWTVTSDALDGSPLPGPTAVSLRFTEAMRGHFSTQVTDPDYQRGVRLGRDAGSRFEFILTLICEDVNRTVAAVDHPARSVGTVVAPALSPHALLVAGGDFNLFVPQPDGSQRMRYRMKMLTREGRTYFMDGFKVIRDDPGLDAWPDTTTLYITVFDGDSDQAAVIGRGILRILPEDFARQLGTMVVTGARNLRQEFRARMDFGRLFLGTLFETYANIAPFLPDVRRRGGIGRAVGALTFAAIVAGLIAWPFRPSVLRQMPALTADGEPPVDLPADVVALGLPPQALRGLDLRPGTYALEHLRFTADLPRDNLVVSHGKLAKIPLHPPYVPALTDLPLRRGFLTLTMIHDPGDATGDRVVAVGSQVETVSFASRPLQRDIRADTTWTLTFPDRGILFLSQQEGGPDIADRQAWAKKNGRDWEGTGTGADRVNHTIGPLAGGRGMVHGGTGDFEGTVGVFREYNSFRRIPAEGDLQGGAEIEITLLRSRPATGSQAWLPAAVSELALPAATLARLAGKRDVHTINRSLRIDLRTDVIYATGGTAPGPLDAIDGPHPGDLGRLDGPGFARVSVFMAKLRDERGDIVGQAGAARVAMTDLSGDPADAEWTLLFPGEGSLFIALDGDSPATGPGPGGAVEAEAPRGFLGRHRGVVHGGTGAFANVAGELRETWPAALAPEAAKPGLQAPGARRSIVILTLTLVSGR